MKIKLNDNKDVVNNIRKAVKSNGGYCPCLIEKSEDTKCMCKAFKEQSIAGSCLCGLYIKYKEGD